MSSTIDMKPSSRIVDDQLRLEILKYLDENVAEVRSKNVKKLYSLTDEDIIQYLPINGASPEWLKQEVSDIAHHIEYIVNKFDKTSMVKPSNAKSTPSTHKSLIIRQFRMRVFKYFYHQLSLGELKELLLASSKLEKAELAHEIVEKFMEAFLCVLDDNGECITANGVKQPLIDVVFTTGRRERGWSSQKGRMPDARSFLRKMGQSEYMPDNYNNADQYLAKHFRGISRFADLKRLVVDIEAIHLISEKCEWCEMSEDTSRYIIYRAYVSDVVLNWVRPGLAGNPHFNGYSAKSTNAPLSWEAMTTP